MWLTRNPERISARWACSGCGDGSGICVHGVFVIHAALYFFSSNIVCRYFINTRTWRIFGKDITRYNYCRLLSVCTCKYCKLYNKHYIIMKYCFSLSGFAG